MSIYKDIPVPDLDYQKFDKRLNETVFIVYEIFESKKSYKKTLEELYMYMKQGFTDEKVRKHPLHFKFSAEKSEPVQTMEVRHFIINMMLWYPFIRYHKVHDLNSSHIYDCHNVTNDNLTGYINTMLIGPYKATIDAKTISKALDDVIYLLSRIYLDFCLVMGLTMDMETFIDLRKKFPRFNELLNTKPEEGMQPKEIEDMIASRLKEYLDIVENKDKTNNLRPFLITGAGINKGQLAQFSIMDGLKPDIEGNVIPKPIDSNFIKGGLNSISNFYIDGQAGSKPLILNKTVMGKSGYFSYKTMTLSSNYRLSQTVEDCHSKRPIKYKVKSQIHLDKINDRYYVGEDGELHRVNSSKDQDLIGKTILLRDPSTCCAHDGICHVCYGDRWYTNRNPLFHAGRYAATQINEPIQQKILSSKHMLRTTSKLIKFDKRFEDFFTLDTNKIKLDLVDSKENFDDWKLFIKEEDLYYSDELAGNEDFNIYIEKFYLVPRKGSKEKAIEFKELSGRDMFLYSNIAGLLKKDVYNNIRGRSLNINILTSEDAIAAINIVNNELSTPLKNIIKLLDRQDHFGCSTIDDMVNKMVDLTIDSGMSVEAVHGSMLIKGLIRQKNHILLPPDFTKEISDDEYQILSVSKALLFNPSLAVSFAFDNANRQIINPMTYKKYKPSDYDIFFKEDIYDNSKKYYKRKKEEKLRKKLRKMAEKYDESHHTKD